MEGIAHARFVRMAPRKTRLVVALVRGMKVAEARRQLAFNAKLASEPVLKVLNSAVANATNNLKLVESDLVITKALVNEGPSFHRFTPRAQGRATPIRRRLSHITIAVGVPTSEAEQPVTKKKSSKKA